MRPVTSWRPAGVILSGRTHTSGTVDLLRQAVIPVGEIRDLTTSPIDMAVGFSHFDCGVEIDNTPSVAVAGARALWARSAGRTSWGRRGWMAS